MEPSQPGDRTDATAGPGIFAGAGTQSLLSQQVILPTGSSNLGQTLAPTIRPVQPEPNAVDHFRMGTVTNNFDPNQRYRTLTGNLSPPISESVGNTFVPQVDPNYTPQTLLPSQPSQHSFLVPTDLWNSSVTGVASAADTQDQPRSTRPSLSANTGNPVRPIDSGTGAKNVKEIEHSGLQFHHYHPTVPSGSKSRKPTTSNRSTASRTARPPVPMFRDSQPTSYPDTESSTHLAPSSRAGSDGRSSPNSGAPRRGKGKERKRD
jgi:hypothetical protein